MKKTGMKRWLALFIALAVFTTACGSDSVSDVASNVADEVEGITEDAEEAMELSLIHI